MITELTTPEQIKAVEDAKLKDLKDKNYLFQSINRGIMETILESNATKGIWDTMKQKHKGTTKVKKSQLQAFRREFKLLGMKDDERISECLALDDREQDENARCELDSRNGCGKGNKVSHA